MSTANEQSSQISRRVPVATSTSVKSARPATRHSNIAERLRPLKCVGKWQLTKLAGKGSYTDVYLARPTGCRPNWPADYAVKMLRTQFANDELAIDFLRREVEVCSQVSHQHLVTVLEAHFGDGENYLVMPRLKGVPVGQVMAKTGYISVRQSLWIIRQVAEALDSLHARGWLHGDVKPDNIMISEEGHVTLIDLGFALRKSEAMVTELRTARGTLNYVAPETMTSALASDERSDIYSLGITLYELLTGKLPFEGRDAAELIDAHRGKPIPDPRKFNARVPDELVRLLSRMTAKQPSRRPHSIRELLIGLLPLEVSAMKLDRVAG